MEYILPQTAESKNYLQFPKWLKYFEISSDAKLLYVYLYDFFRMAEDNPAYIDDQGRVFVICTRVAMQELLGCAKGTAIKAVKELIDLDLLEEKRGRQEANKIYLKMPSSKEIKELSQSNKEKKEAAKNKKSKIWTSKNWTSRGSKIELQEVQNLNPNNNNINKTNNIYNNITNNTDVVDDTATAEEVFDNSQTKISLEKLRLQDAYQLEQNFYAKPDVAFKSFISKLTKADKTTVNDFNEEKIWDLYWKFLLLNRYIPDDLNELPEGIKSPNAYLIGIIRNMSKDSDY